jgi:hypothetical protein
MDRVVLTDEVDTTNREPSPEARRIIRQALAQALHRQRSAK